MNSLPGHSNNKLVEVAHIFHILGSYSQENILSGLASYPELLLMQLPKERPLKDSISFMHNH